MTEEIIIDGIDVSGCEYYHKVDSICDNENNHNVGCGQYDTCTYKQLKRLEQENRELKAYKNINEDFKKAWDELNKKYTEVLKLAKENADSNEYCLQELEKENEQLRSALEEIREIAENAKEGRYATKSEDYTEGMRIIGCYVLNKINEVLK